jgi:RimJ/RimL family protein N-acetyltransferase
MTHNTAQLGIVKFKAEHLIGILHDGAIECGVVESPGDGVLSLAMARERAGMSFAVLCCDKLWGCGGLDILWAGVAEGWAFFSPAIRENPLGITRAVKTRLSELMMDLELHRVQCHVRHDLYPALRFVQALGFTEEGTNLKFTHDGVDCKEFAMVN